MKHPVIVFNRSVADEEGTKVIRQSKQAPELAALLDSHREEIASAWAEMVWQLPGSHYRERSLDELRISVLRIMDAIVEALSTTSYQALDQYLADISEFRWKLGFDISEVVEGLLLLREAVLPFLWRGPPESYEIIIAFDSLLRYMLGRFSRLYTEAANQHLADQQRQTAIMEERQRLARELHDSVTQSLYSITLYAEAVACTLGAGNKEKALEQLRMLQEAAQEALREMRLLIFDLHPPILEKEGLVTALHTRLEAVESRGGVKTNLLVEGAERLPITVEEELYRIAQEALNNVLKHAKAKVVMVHLRLGQREVSMEIVDDGVGFDPAAMQDKRGFGLSSIRERVSKLGASMLVESAPGKGTRLRVEVPLHLMQ